MVEASLTCPDAPSDTGAYRISWSGPDGAAYQLTENGEVLYQGRQTASTVSGRAEGDYTYQLGLVGAAGGIEAVDHCEVAVRPPDLQLAFLLFGVGLLVFVATAAVIVHGHRAHRRGELSS